MAQLMPLPLTVSCFSKIQIGFSPGRKAVKWVCVCVCVCMFFSAEENAVVERCSSVFYWSYAASSGVVARS